MKSILIKDTTREERIRIVTQSLQVCGQTCEFCNGCEIWAAVWWTAISSRISTAKRRLQS